jgi:hypothetical protein
LNQKGISEIDAVLATSSFQPTAVEEDVDYESKYRNLLSEHLKLGVEKKEKEEECESVKGMCCLYVWICISCCFCCSRAKFV